MEWSGLGKNIEPRVAMSYVLRVGFCVLGGIVALHTTLLTTLKAKR
jgi:hypothetical protein